MAITVNGIKCAEGYTDVAMLGSQLGDPVLKDIGCIPEGFFGDLDGEAACNVFYEPAIDEGVNTQPTAALGNYTAETAANATLPVIWNNTFQKMQKLPADAVDGVPYDIANVRLESLGKANARANGKRELACLFNEGVQYAYASAATKDNVLERIYQAREAIKSSGANPTIAVCSPEFYTALKMALPNAIASDELNSRMLSGTVGIYDGIRWVESPFVNAGTVYYNDYASTPQSPLMKGIDFIMWDGSKFAAINKLFEVAIKDGGASFPGVGACYAAKLGVRLLETRAAYTSGMGNTQITTNGVAEVNQRYNFTLGTQMGFTFADEVTHGYFLNKATTLTVNAPAVDGKAATIDISGTTTTGDSGASATLSKTVNPGDFVAISVTWA